MKLLVKLSSLYPKLVLSFLLLVIPIFLTSLIMNRSGQNTVKQQITDSMASRVHFYLTSVATEIERLNRLQLEYVNDEELLGLGTVAERMDDFERTKAIMSVKNKLYLLKSSSPYVENVKLYIAELGRSVFANTYDDSIPPEELQAILKPANMRSTIYSFEGRLLLSEVYPDTIYVNRYPVLAIEIELSRAEFIRTLTSVASGEHGGAVLIADNQSWTLSSGGDQALADEIAARLRLQADGQAAAIEQPLKVASGGNTYFVTYEHSQKLDLTLAVFVPEPTILAPLTRHQRWLWVFSFISLLMVGGFSYWIYRLIHKPLKRLVLSFRKVEKGDMGIRVVHRNHDEFQYLYGQFNQMLERIQELIHEVYEQRIRSQTSELKQLQSQINPHFFYNSFFNLLGLVRMQENALAERMLVNLGQYFQFITRTGQERIPLRLEWNHTVSYVEIQRIRFMDSVEVKLDEIPPAWEEVMVPRLIIQPLVENAYIHGLENKPEGGKLSIRIREEEESCLLIEVEDNGTQLDETRLEQIRSSLSRSERAMETTGILNVHRRLQLALGGECGLSVFKGEYGGLKIRLTIRKEEETGIDQTVDRR